MCRTLHLAGRDLLFLFSRFSNHCITAITFIRVNENNLCLGINRDCIFWAGNFAWSIITMMTKEGFKEGVTFKHPDQPWPYTQPVLLFAGYFTGMTAHAFSLIKHQRYFWHRFPPDSILHKERYCTNKPLNLLTPWQDPVSHKHYSSGC